jgi:hypothetical protein
MRRLKLAVILAMTLLPAQAGSAAQPRPRDRESSLTHAVFAEGRLWLLSDAGELSYIIAGKDDRAEERLSEPVLDLCLQDGHPLIITCDQESCRNWKLRRWVEGEWSTEDSISTQGDDLVGLSCAGDRVGTLTSKRLIETENGAQTSVILSDEISPKLVVTTLDTPSQLIVGVNQGEFGGGLWRIDRGTGQIAAIEGKATGKFCRDSLDTNCDPINGIAIEPWNPACMLIAVGVVHFGPFGRIAEVRGDSVRTFFSKPYEEDPAGSSKRERADRVGHVAFFSMFERTASCGPPVSTGSIASMHMARPGPRHYPSSRESGTWT